MAIYEELDPDFKKQIMTRMQSVSPFWSLIGMEVVDVKKGWARIRVPFAEKLTNAIGIVHGGVIFSPADSAVGVAIIGMLGKRETITTVEMKINYLKPFKEGEIFAEAKIIHKGNNTVVGDVEVRDSNENLVAKALATYMIIKK